MNEKEWIKLSFTCQGQVKELISGFCFDLGACGSDENDTSIRVYFNTKDFSSSVKKRILQYTDFLKAEGFEINAPRITIIKNQNWNSEWKKYFKPVKVSNKTVVKPPWENFSGEQEIIIDIYPRMAFGTGTHETTKLCLRFLEDVVTPDCTVLDVGCGSGILSIASVKMGASSSLGIDVDPEAVKNSIENANLNKVENRTEFKNCQINHIPADKYDVIVINILTKTLKTILPDIPPFCHKNTKMIFTGIQISEENDFIRFCKNLSIEIKDRKTDNEWLALLCRCSDV